MSFRLLFPLAIIALWVMMALLGSLFALEPNQIALPKILLSGDSEALLGYDDLGRPLWDRLVMGAQTSFLVAFGVVSISVVLGTLIGSVSGYVGGWFDHLVTRIIDIFLAFPGILLAIALAGILGPGVENVVIALAVVSWVGFARLSRAQVLTIKHRDHVQAAIALGVAPPLIILRHLIPLIMAPLIIEATFGVASVVIAEAGLSFLGLGVQAPEASWGSMIRDGTRYLLVAPHMILVPGVALMLVVLAANLLGDQLRDRLDIRSQNSR